MTGRWRRPVPRHALPRPETSRGTSSAPHGLEEILAVIGRGWEPLVRHAVTIVRAAGGDLRLVAVREKVGRLDLWWAGHAATADGQAVAIATLEALEDLSLRICQACGQPAVAGGPWPHDSWTRTLCVTHQAAYWTGMTWEALLDVPAPGPRPGDRGA